MEKVNEFKNIAMESLKAMWLEMSSVFPNIIGAIIILIFGWLVTKLIVKAIKKILKLSRANKLDDKLNDIEIIEGKKLNFDTGHAWASKENLYLIPAKLGKRIAGTHLCDNFQNENLSLRPGAGSIDWPRIVKALRLAGYDGWFDLEIICRLVMIHKEYREGKDTIYRLLEE